MTPPQFASRAALEAEQLKRMQWSIAHAYDNTTYYRAKCDAAGVAPVDLKSLSDLARFPFTLKSDFRENYPFGMFAVPRERCARIHASSGTTGKPTIVGYTRADLDLWNALVARCILAAGGRPGDLIHNAYGYGLFTGGLGLHGGAEALGCAVVPASGGQTERQLQLICDLKPRIICCTPSYMLVLAEALEQAGIDPRDTSLEIGMHGAEPWSEEMRQRDRKALRHLGARYIWAFGSARPWRGAGACRRARKPDRLGRCVLARDCRSHHRRTAAGR